MMRLFGYTVRALAIGLSGLLALGVLSTSNMIWTASAADETCCKEGDTTRPSELVAKVPYGGTGGGGICPPLTQGAWFWGNTDDVLFRLITLGSVDLEKQGYRRLGYGSVHAPMPPMGMTIKTSDDLWKIIAWIRSINPPGSNPPDKVLPQE